MVITRMGLSRLDKAIVIPVWQMASSAGLETERAHSLKRSEGERRALVRVLLIDRHPGTCAWPLQSQEKLRKSVALEFRWR
jgi:hypothetical protein